MMKIKLGDICTFQSGGTPTKGTKEFFNGTIPWITTTALNGGKIDGTQAVNWITEKAIEKSAAKLVPAFSIMVGTRVGVGKVAVNTVQMSTSQDIISLINIDENRWDKDYLCKYIQGKNAFLNSQARGATIKGIKMDVLANLELEEITLENQARISETIDRVKVILDARKNELLELDKLVKARFVELTESVNTVATRMGDIATYINGYAFKPTDWTESGLPIIRIQNLNDVNAKYNYFDGKIDSKYLVTTGDVLVSWATHLEAYIWDGDSAWLNQHIFKALFDKMPINKLYFVYATEDALRQAFKNAHGFKPTMEHIKRRDFENAIVKLPDMEIQNQFADFVVRTGKSKLLEERQVGFIAKIS